MTATTPPESIDLFGGPGGWKVGARLAGVRPPHGLELDEHAVATARAAGFTQHMVDVTRPAPRGWTRLRGYRDGSHMSGGLCGSPSCRRWSAAGLGDGPAALSAFYDAAWDMLRGRDPRPALIAGGVHPDAVLVLEPLRWAIALRPAWVALEQTPAVLPFWEECGRILRVMGYSVWTGELSATQFGVGQDRRRAVLVANRTRDVVDPNTLATHSRYDRRWPKRLEPGLQPWRTAADVLVEAGRTAPLPSWAHERPSTTVVGSFRPDVIRGPGYRRAGDGPCQNAPGSFTVTRAEASALQGFPVDYPWQGSEAAVRRQIGDAIPPPLAAAVQLAAGAPTEVAA